jgi:hypothetical protein
LSAMSAAAAAGTWGPALVHRIASSVAAPCEQMQWAA